MAAIQLIKIAFLSALAGASLIWAADQGATQERTRWKDFTRPTVAGYPVDLCLRWGAQCGKPAADAFCRSQGYLEASSHTVINDSPPTWVMSENRICNLPQCDRLNTIRCVAEDPGSGQPGTGAGGGGGGGTGDPQEPEPQISASLTCTPLSITISELPPRDCTIRISGWNRRSSEPVEVFFPQATDTFGNHPNGIQIFGGGREYPLDWGDVKNWNLLIFACRSQQGTGANCYGANTAPGSFSVPIVVRQKGARAASISLSGTAISKTPQPVNFSGLTRIQNRWRPDQYINIEKGLTSGPIQATWWSAIWLIEPLEGGMVRIRSRWQPGSYLHIENGRLEAGPIQPSWWSAVWMLEPAEGEFVRIRNRWRPDQYLHIEDGALTAGAIQPAWWSAMWRVGPL